MLTPQDIKDMQFSKAVFGGYDMTAVDDFLENVQESYTALYKENAILKSKLKVLVEKVEEYRSTEDAMRMALLTAQKMSDDMTEEAKKKSEEILAAAEHEAENKKAALVEDTAEEEARLAAAKRETARFVAASREIIARHESFLNGLEALDLKISEEPPKAAAPVYEDEPPVSPEPEPARRAEPQEKTPEPAVEEAPAEEPKPAEKTAETILDEVIREIDAAAEEKEEPEVKPLFDDAETKALPDIESLKNIKPAGWTEEDELTTPRPKFDFTDLQFGSNYDSKDKK